MTPEEKQIIVAEFCGWKRKEIKDGNKFSDPIQDLLVIRWVNCKTKQVQRNLPDYGNDLNAMREAELLLLENVYDDFLDNLCILIFGDKAQMDGSYIEMGAMMKATAQQRQDAFIRAIGKWKD